MDLFKKKKKEFLPGSPEEPAGIAGKPFGGLPAPSPEEEEEAGPIGMPPMKGAPQDVARDMGTEYSEADAIKGQVGHFEDEGVPFETPLPPEEGQEFEEYEPEEYEELEEPGETLDVGEAPEEDFSFLQGKPPGKAKGPGPEPEEFGKAPEAEQPAATEELIDSVTESVRKELDEKIKLLESEIEGLKKAEEKIEKVAGEFEGFREKYEELAEKLEEVSELSESDIPEIKGSVAEIQNLLKTALPAMIKEIRGSKGPEENKGYH